MEESGQAGIGRMGRMGHILRPPDLESRQRGALKVQRTAGDNRLVAARAITAAESRAFFARLGFVDGHVPALPLRAVEGCDGGLGTFGRLHSDKGKSARALRDFVHDEVDLLNGTVCSKHILEIVFGDVEGEIPDV